MMSYGYTGFSTADIYNSVISDVMKGVKEAFLDEDVDLTVLEKMKSDWATRVDATGCVERKPTKPHFLPPPIRGPPLAHINTQDSRPGSLYQLPNHAYANSEVQIIDPNQHRFVFVQNLNPAQQYQPQTPSGALDYRKRAPDGTLYPVDAPVEADLPTLAPSTIPNSSMYQLDGQGDRGIEDVEDSRAVGVKHKEKKLKQKVPRREADKALARLMKAVQLDGNGKTMSDSSSEDEDIDPLRRLADKLNNSGNDGPQEDMELADDEPPLGSDDDEIDQIVEGVFDTDNVIICQFERVHRTRTKWKMNLKDGIMHIENRDHCFSKATGEATF